VRSDLLLLLLPLLSACAGSGAGDTAPASADDSGADPSSPEPEGAWVDAGHLSGELRFTLSPYDGEGRESCSYTRAFDGVELVGLMDWACPSCGMAFGGAVTVPEEGRDCFESWFPQHLSYTLMDRTEYWGWKNVQFYRSSVPSLGTSVGAEGFGAPEEGESVSFSYSSVSSGAETALLEVEGTLGWTLDARVPDPVAARSGPYLCGWPQADATDIDAPEAIGIGQVAPELPMVDQCGEPVSLRHFTGERLLFVAAAPDCDACVYTALTASSYASSHDLRVVVLFEGDDEEFAEAAGTYGALGPVLQNRHYTQVMSLWLFGWTPPGAQWWLVDPDQVVVAAGTTTLDFSELDEVL
jgi:hypothetical protein